MNKIEPILAGKRPATVTTYDARPVLTLTAPYHRKADLVAIVNRQAARGEIRPIDARATWNERAGFWEQRVLRLRPPAPAWIKPAIILGTALTVLVGLLALAWWVLTSLAMVPLVLLLVGAGAVLMGLTRAGKRQTVTIVNNNYVRMR